MDTLTLSISGMHCASCSKLITMDLEDIGVTASIDRDTGKGKVTFDPQKVSQDQILDQIKKSGYQASVITGGTAQ